MLLALGTAAAGLGLAAFAARTLGLRSRRGRALVGAGLAIAGLAIAGAAVLSSRPALPAPDIIDARRDPFPATRESLEIGMRVYQTHCQACHGESGHGDGPLATTLVRRPVDFWLHFGSGHTHSDGRLFFWISNGMPGTGMPPFRDRLSEAERWHVVNFIKKFTPVDR